MQPALIALVLAVGTVAQAAPETPVTLPQAPVPIMESATPSFTPALSLEAADQMMAEIRALLDAQLAAETADVANLADASPAQRAEISRRANEAGAQVAIDLLQVQIRYAREAGLDDAARELEAAVQLRIDAQASPTHLPEGAVVHSDRVPPKSPEATKTPADATQTGEFVKGGEQK